MIDIDDEDVINTIHDNLDGSSIEQNMLDTYQENFEPEEPDYD